MKRRQLHNEFRHCDCRAELPRLASNTIDLIVTSPPWDGIFDCENGPAGVNENDVPFLANDKEALALIEMLMRKYAIG